MHDRTISDKQMCVTVKKEILGLLNRYHDKEEIQANDLRDHW